MILLKNYSLYNWQIFSYDSVTSTNDIAALSDTPSTENLKKIFLATAQTNGRGRRGRSWISPHGNLYMSQLLNSSRPINELVYITSLSIAQTLKQFAPNLNFSIKWPNDILLNDAKICGVLIEKTPTEHTIIGIGINLQSSPANNEVIYPTTNLADNNCNLQIDDFLNAYLPVFENNCQIDFSIIRKEWLQSAHNLNKIITVCPNAHNKISGQFMGIDEQGNLLLEQENNIIKITTGEIIY